MKFVTTAPDKPLTHEEIAWKISHQREFGGQDQVGAQRLSLLRPVDDKRGISADVAGGGIDLE